MHSFFVLLGSWRRMDLSQPLVFVESLSVWLGEKNQNALYVVFFKNRINLYCFQEVTSSTVYLTPIP